MRRSNTKNRKAQRSSLEEAVLNQARDYPQRGQGKAAEELKRQGYSVSTSGVRYIWAKHDLETTYKRLKALEAGGGGKAQPLTERQKEFLKRGEVSRKLSRRSRQAVAGADLALPDERRSHILLAAAELFVKHGYSGTSIRDIAREAGLLPGSVYHYYPAKEDLFIAVHHEGFRQLITRVEDVLKREKDAWRRLELACAAHIESVVGGNSIHKITGTGLFSIHEQGLQRRLKADRVRYEQIFRTLVGDLKLSKSVNPTVFRLALLGAVNWSRVWYRAGKKSPADVARAMVAIFRASAR